MNANEAKLKLLVQQLSKKNTTELAKELSTHILTGLKTNNKELHNIFAELAVEIAALSRRMDDANNAPTTDFDQSFGKLADSLNKDVVASLSDEQIVNMSNHIGQVLSDAVSSMNLEKLANDTVEVKGLDKMLEKLVNKIPSKIDGKVTLAYNKAAAKDYINVRLTNGEAFVDSILGAVGRGPGLPLIKVAGDVMALPVVNPDGTFIGGGGGLTDEQLRATPVPVSFATTLNDDLVLMDYHTGNDNLIYVGTAANGSAQADAVWSILRMDLTNLLAVTYAPGYLASTDVWDDRESIF